MKTRKQTCRMYFLETSASFAVFIFDYRCFGVRQEPSGSSQHTMRIYYQGGWDSPGYPHTCKYLSLTTNFSPSIPRVQPTTRTIRSKQPGQRDQSPPTCPYTWCPNLSPFPHFSLCLSKSSGIFVETCLFVEIVVYFHQNKKRRRSRKGKVSL